LKLTKQY